MGGGPKKRSKPMAKAVSEDRPALCDFDSRLQLPKRNMSKFARADQRLQNVLVGREVGWSGFFVEPRILKIRQRHAMRPGLKKRAMRRRYPEDSRIQRRFQSPGGDQIRHCRAIHIDRGMRVIFFGGKQLPFSDIEKLRIRLFRKNKVAINPDWHVDSFIKHEQQQGGFDLPAADTKAVGIAHDEIGDGHRPLSKRCERCRAEANELVIGALLQDRDGQQLDAYTVGFAIFVGHET
jgi:hypothetical protein